MADIKIVTKSLGGAEDLLLGVDPVTQVRNGTAVQVNQLHSPVAVSTTIKLANLNPAISPYACVTTAADTTYYNYSESDLSGIASAFGGSWVIEKSSNYNDDINLKVQQPYTGALLRTQHDKNAESVSITDFTGADKTGVALCDTAFANAELAADNIYVPPGTYRLSTPMILGQSKKYFGPGKLKFDNAEWWRRGGSSGSVSVPENYTLFYDYANQSDVSVTFDNVTQSITWVDARTVQAPGSATSVNVKINIVNGTLDLGPVPENVRSYNMLINGGHKLAPALPNPTTAPVGYDNTSFGPRALMDLETGVNNTAIGSKSLMSNKVGINNTGVGFLTLYRALGDANTAVGSVAGEWLTTGGYNTFLGASAGEKTKDGAYNVAVGFQALGESFTTKWNVAVGYRANANTGDASQSNSVYVGAFAGDFNIGSNNTMVGYRAGNCLDAATAPGTGVGHDNVGIGMFAMRKNLAGNESVVIGAGAATESTVVQRSVVLGFGAAGVTATLGSFTVAIGYNAGSVVTADNNVLIGQQAGLTITTGAANTVLGSGALVTNVSGANNTAIGFNSGRLTQAGVATTSLANTTTIGNDARVAASNEVQIGNSATTTYVYGTVQNRSDSRDKADVQDTKLGIEFINGLRPVSGKWNLRDDYVITTENDDGTFSSVFDQVGYDAETKKRTREHQWFIAQEVEELVNTLGVGEFGGLQHKAVIGGEDSYTLGYDEFIPPVVKAIQQCWSRLDELEARLKALETK